MLHRYLNWKGMKTKVFNAGDYRRIVTLSLYSNGQSGHTGESSSFFDPRNKEAMELRAYYASLALEGFLFLSLYSL